MVKIICDSYCEYSSFGRCLKQSIILEQLETDEGEIIVVCTDLTTEAS